MKKVIILICLAMLVMTGCKTDKKVDNTVTNIDSTVESQSETQTKTASDKSQSLYMWEEVPEFDNNIDVSQASSDEALAKTLNVYDGISKVDDLVTDDVKNDMISIINQWYNNKFYNVKNIKKDEMLKLDIESFEKETVMCDKKPYIKITFRVSAMNGGLKADDRLNALIDCSKDKYSVYKMWYYGKYRNTSGSF